MIHYKTTFTIIFAVTVSVVIFYFSLDLAVENFDPSWSGLVNTSDSTVSKHRIFILGSSSVYPIDAGYINQILSYNNKDYIVYNLADMSDFPSERIKTVKKLTSFKPSLIVYGVGLADFEKPFSYNNSQYNSANKLFNEFLNPRLFFLDLLSYLTNIDFGDKFPFSPKDRTLLTLKYVIRGPEYPFHPFINFKKTNITNSYTLEKLYENRTFRGIDHSSDNKQIQTLKEIINEFKKNDIKVVLFTNPYHRTYLEKWQESDKLFFIDILKKISNETDADVYIIYEKYADLNIWFDNAHVAVTEDAIIYSQDIAEIILKEIQNNAL